MSSVGPRSLLLISIAVVLIGGSDSMLAAQESTSVPGLPESRSGVAVLLAQRGADIGPDAAAGRAAGATGGRVLRVRRREGLGGPVYDVKVLLPGGRVRMVRVDASSGRLLD